MKTTTLIITIVVGFLISSISAQETIWFDSNWKVSTKEKAAYYRPAPKKIDNGYLIIDYYISGKKQMKGFSTSSSPNEEMYIGIVSYFHENEKIFQKVNYVDGKPEGSFSEFYDTGETQRVGKYSKGLRSGVWKTYSKKGKIQSRGKYKKGEKVGVWKTFHKNI
jgi:antitoxin component YwqK of YwqJK toxin-antitoxin module